MFGLRNTVMKARKRGTEQLRKKLFKNPEIINDLFSNEEWEQHQPADELSAKQSAQMQQRILQLIELKENAAARKLRIWSGFYTAGKYAIAACLLLVFAWVIERDWNPVQPVKNFNTAAVKNNTAAQPVQWDEVSNTTAAVKHIPLPDSSVVALYPQGKLRYEKGLSKPLRDVYLVGKAYFKVKRNPARPFSVYAGGLKTTALGTSFTINTVAGKERTSVKLHTGKIVVSAEIATSKQQPVYLTKAESGLIYDRQSQLASSIKQPKAVKIIPETSLTHEGDLIIMKNIPLVKVVTMLSSAYQVKIQANSKEIGNITYTGEVNTKTESIESVLNMICLINNMSLSRGTAQEYILQKNK